MQNQSISFQKIKKILFYFKYNFERKLRIFFNIDQKIKIDDRKIILPPEHPLSMWSSLYKEYDKFLPKIIENIKFNESITQRDNIIGSYYEKIFNIKILQILQYILFLANINFLNNL